MNEINYHKNTYLVVYRAFNSIPKLKHGKTDANAIVSYIQDIDIFKRFANKYIMIDTFPMKSKYINDWNNFIKLREEEDYIPHNESKNYLGYQNLFN